MLKMLTEMPNHSSHDNLYLHTHVFNCDLPLACRGYLRACVLTAFYRWLVVGYIYTHTFLTVIYRWLVGYIYTVACNKVIQANDRSPQDRERTFKTMLENARVNVKRIVIENVTVNKTFELASGLD